MLSYMIVVNDNGELKQISQQEIFDFHAQTDRAVESAINMILDQRSLRLGARSRSDTFRVQKTVDGGTVVVRSTPEEMAADDAEDRAIGARLDALNRKLP